jgi:hypothetical protein
MGMDTLHSLIANLILWRIKVWTFILISSYVYLSSLYTASELLSLNLLMPHYVSAGAASSG